MAGELSLTRLRQLYVVEERPLPADVERALRRDPRIGAQAVLAAVQRRRRDNRAEGQRLAHMLRYEKDLWKKGLRAVAGVDEAGMSPLAGPVVAAAAILPPGCRIRYVDDSKKLTPEQRETLADEIRARALATSIGFASAAEIDRINIYHAGLLAMRRAVEGLSLTPDYLLVDARPVALPIPQDRIVKGDAKSLSIAAASILAKTTRDAWMRDLDTAYPGYGFSQHKGYPVRAHKKALEILGPCPAHRRSFAHVRTCLQNQPSEQLQFFS